jgi:pimeloyl-ACP methyl ester carboxylesterase
MREDNSILNLTFHVKTITFLMIGTIVTGISVSSLIFNQNQPAMAQQQLQGVQNNQTSSSLTKQQQISGTFFQMDNMTFSQHTTSVNGIQLHYVIGGHGNPVVLLHGWPETWYEWHLVMPALAKNYTVIAPDLPGLGDSSKPLTGYDGKTVAADIHQLVTQLGFKTIFLVGHDIGTQVAYSYAAAYPIEVKRLVVMDFTLPGFGPAGKMPPWWSIFHQTPDVPEALVQGKELMYLSWFYHNLAYNPAAITQADINEFVSHYSAPGGMRAGFEYYRAFPQDAIQNMNYSKTKLTMPVLALGAGYIPTFGGNVTMPTILYGMKILAQNASGIIVPNSGHWIPEERPDFVIKMLDTFFGGSSTKTTK